MGKITRYFDQNNEEISDKSKTKEIKDENKKTVKIYNVDTKIRLKFKKDNKINQKGSKKSNSKYPGKPPVSKELLKKHSRGPGLNKHGVKTDIYKKKLDRKDKTIKYAHELAARTEVLLPEDTGYLEADDGETTTQFRQSDIIKDVDITAVTKHFDLNLKEFGPYRAKYTRNGRHLLLGGKKGHVAAIDWATKKLHCELNVMESIHDISWLHIETMFAVAQKSWVYIYDYQGIELHCLKQLHNVSQMEFLPYHFLLNTSNEEGILSWLDISIGQIVAQYNTRLGKTSVMTQNPYNAVTCLAHPKGIVSMWAPKTRDPLAKILCHKAPITALHVDSTGTYMATAATDKLLKIWDIRMLEGPLQVYHLSSTANNLAFSQKNLLAVGMGNIVEVYRNCCAKSTSKAYLRHCFNTSIRNLQFCPYEDVLGVATEWGFTSLIVPGAGEPNFDGLEANPYQTKSQRREFEVKALLEKIQPELINLNPNIISEVNVPTLKEKVAAKEKLLFVKPPKINYQPRNKAKGKGGSVKISRNKKIVQETAKREFLKTKKDLDNTEHKNNNKAKEKRKDHKILDRFVKNS